VNKELQEAIEFAEGSDFPTEEEIYTDMFWEERKSAL
jgi:hypothetical protein